MSATYARALRPIESAYNQRGAATLFVTLIILLVLGLVVFGSAAIGMFEQRTASNENRARLAEQAAEYALTLGGEYIKANVTKISTTDSGGWLDSANASNRRWQSCAPITDSSHPCFAERDASRRAQMYYFTSDGSSVADGSSAKLDLPLTSASEFPTNSKLASIGGDAKFPVTARVSALLCRIEETAGGGAECALSPKKGRRIAVTLVASASLPDESAAAVVKETWGTLTTRSYSASTPLVASGFVEFVGNYTVVSAPNAGGFGVAASVWSPNNVSGNGAWKTCTRDDYLNGADLSQLEQCGGAINCACNSEVASNKSEEGSDIIDVDGGVVAGVGSLPDITFFPGKNAAGTRMDNPAVNTDDNLFEWIFGVDVTGGNGDTVLENCGPDNNVDCEVQALSDLGFDSSHSDCSFLNEDSSGLYYVPGTGACSLPGQVGSPGKCVVLVVDEEFTFGHKGDYYGMVFVRSKDGTAQAKGNANGYFFGSIVLEGGGKFNGTMDLVYNDCDAGSPDDALAESTRFGRLPGSWLDSSTGF